jgi:hypothetical protein
LGGGYQQNRRCARTIGVKQRDRGEPTIEQNRRRRQQRRGRRVTHAHYAQNAVVAGVILMLRSRRAIVVGIGMTHANAIQRIGSLSLRHTGERHHEQNLAPCGEHQGGKTNGAYPSV